MRNIVVASSLVFLINDAKLLFKLLYHNYMKYFFHFSLFSHFLYSIYSNKVIFNTL